MLQSHDDDHEESVSQTSRLRIAVRVVQSFLPQQRNAQRVVQNSND